MTVENPGSFSQKDEQECSCYGFSGSCGESVEAAGQHYAQRSDPDSLAAVSENREDTSGDAVDDAQMHARKCQDMGRAAGAERVAYSAGYAASVPGKQSLDQSRSVRVCEWDRIYALLQSSAAADGQGSDVPVGPDFGQLHDSCIAEAEYAGKECSAYDSGHDCRLLPSPNRKNVCACGCGYPRRHCCGEHRKAFCCGNCTRRKNAGGKR